MNIVTRGFGENKLITKGYGGTPVNAGVSSPYPFFLGMAGVPASITAKGFREPFPFFTGMAGRSSGAPGVALDGFRGPFAFFTGMSGTGTTTPPITPPTVTRGGGRMVGYFPDYKKPKKKVLLKLPNYDEKELVKLIRKEAGLSPYISTEEFRGIVTLTEKALEAANTFDITVSMSEKQIKAYKKRLQDEDILLFMLDDEPPGEQ